MSTAKRALLAASAPSVVEDLPTRREVNLASATMSARGRVGSWVVVRLEGSSTATAMAVCASAAATAVDALIVQPPHCANTASLAVACCLLPIAYCPLPIAYCMLHVACAEPQGAISAACAYVYLATTYPPTDRHPRPHTHTPKHNNNHPSDHLVLL